MIDTAAQSSQTSATPQPTPTPCAPRARARLPCPRSSWALPGVPFTTFAGGASPGRACLPSAKTHRETPLACRLKT